MIKLLKNANVYTPSPIGKKDILIEGEKILRIADHIDGYENLPDVEIYDLNGKTVVPGYIDMHVHITGGGGEQGPASRVPESQLSEFFKNGIYWCIRKGDENISDDLKKLLWKDKVFFIQIEGFDELMAELNKRLNKGVLPIDNAILSSEHQIKLIKSLI